MPHNDVHRVLSRAANDPAFRDQIARAPEEALADYALTTEQRQQFADGGEAAMALLSWWSRGDAPPASKVDTQPERPEALSDGAVPMEPLLFTLQLQPTTQPGPDGQAYIAHAAALHAGDVAGLPGASFTLRLAPLATPQPGGSMHIHYTATVDPKVAASADLSADTAVPTNPWGHATDSPAAQQAAQAVHQASPADRRAAIMDLIAAVTGRGA